MKKILYPRICSFCAKELSKVVDNDPNYISDVKMDMYKRYSLIDEDMRDIEFSMYIKNIDREISDIVEDSFYGKDAILCHKLKISILLSLLNSFTLSKVNLKKFNKYKNISYYVNALGDKQPIAHYDYENFISSLIKDNENNCPLLIDLDVKYKDYVAFVVQKIRMNIYSMVKEIANIESCPDDIIENVISNFDVEEGDD